MFLLYDSTWLNAILSIIAFISFFFSIIFFLWVLFFPDEEEMPWHYILIFSFSLLIFWIVFTKLLSYDVKNYCENIKHWKLKSWYELNDILWFEKCFYLEKWKLKKLDSKEIQKILDDNEYKERVNNYLERSKKAFSEKLKIENEIKNELLKLKN